MICNMQYELLYIVPTTFTDEDVGKIEGTVKGLLEKYGATISETIRLGKFRLAYPIKKVRHGHYILVKVETEPANVAKVDEALRLSNDVLRHLLLRADEVGGDKFELIQFTEVNVDTKDERPRRKREGEVEKKVGDELKEGVAAIESKEKSAEEKKEPALGISDEELDKKLTAALEDDAKEV